MKEIQQRILKDGKYLGNGVLKVDSFLNHQLDSNLMLRAGQAFAKHFDGVKIDRILTIESSGIAIAIMLGYVLNVPVVYARKKKPITMFGPVFLETAPSHTKGNEVQILVSAEYLIKGENVLILDDFFASGKTILALSRIVSSAQCTIAGVATMIEKSFENGREFLASKGYDNLNIKSLAIIEKMSSDGVEFKD